MAKAKPTAAGAGNDAPVRRTKVLKTASATDEPALLGEGREKTVATLTHVLGLLTLFVGPLAMYFVFKRKATPWLRNHLDEAINYHILLVVAFILVVVALALLSKFTTAVTVLAIVLLLLVAIHVVFGVIAIVWAARGKSYHFPLDIKIVR